MQGRRPLFVLVALLTAVLPAGAQPSLEYAVKAAYLTKFVPFIAWPDNAFASATAPVNLCILGSDPFGAALDKAAAAPGGGRPIAVRRIVRVDETAGCQVLFTADPTMGVIDALRDKPVVTVTDSGMQGRGIISFVMANNHVRFDIDDASAEHNGLRISSKLLELARNVTRKAAP